MDHGKVSPQIAQGLLALRRRIEAAGIPSSKLDETLNLASWNVREFGKTPRTEAAIHYIAEILGQFDLVALVELRDDLGDLERVMRVLGPYWRVLYSDYDSDAPGNHERMAYLYDKRAVVPTGLAAEASPPRAKAGKDYAASFTWWRSPYMASFRAGSFDFILVASHTRWGVSEKERIVELQGLHDWIVARAAQPHVEDQDFILMGDFNIPSLKSPLYKALAGTELTMPPKLASLTGTNLLKDARYDQILHFPKYTKAFERNGGGVEAGAVDFYQGDWTPLFPAKEYPKLKGDDFTFQISDHLPIWCQIVTDVVDEKLEQRVAPPVEARAR
ncbi:MAG: hypothetical protein QOG31_935 [Thermoplasmata archaeon]|jgi:endonuclease/exonuclease/phosphatase family metal-dependent hydrolase|nr:hypothetical protein [Thermoplasmata archaeon]